MNRPAPSFGAKSIGEIVINTPAPLWLRPSSGPPGHGTGISPSPRRRSCWAGMNKHIIYLAAGSGSRFGSNKLLCPLEGKPLFRHGLDTLVLWSGPGRTVI